MMLGQRIINAILRPLIALLLPYDVQGTENLPTQGPVLVMLNHTNLVDVVLPAMFLPRDVVMLSKIENFSLPVLGLFVRAYGAIPLHRGEVDLQAVRLSLKALKEDKVLAIAPEGTRSGDGRLQPGHDGLAYVAALAGVPVVPFAIYGHANLWSRLKRLRRTRLHIRVGEPFCFVGPRRPSRQVLHAMTDEAMHRLAAALPGEFRGQYADGAQAIDRYTTHYRQPAAESA